MEFLKLKLASNFTGFKLRFDYCDPLVGFDKPESSGHLPHELDFHYGTPSIDRKENVRLILSDVASKTSITATFKWRPDTQKSPTVVCLISTLSISVNNIRYEYDSSEAYEPTISSVRPGRITQYGSKGSQLKLFVGSPYRRLRLFFRGHMRHLPKMDSTFVRLNIVVSTTAEIFDFYDEYNVDCLRVLYSSRKMSRGPRQAIQDLVSHDRHELLVQAKVQLSIGEAEHVISERRPLWGFYTRQFFKLDEEPQVVSKRLLGHFNNGQAFHICNRRLDDDEMDGGFTCFEIVPKTVPIDKPFVLDWVKVGKDEDFELQVSGQGLSFECKCQKRLDGLNFYDSTLGGVDGWAVTFLDDERDSESHQQTIVSCLAAYRKSLSEGLIEGVGTPVDNKPMVVSISDDSTTDLVGSKAASLARLTRFARKCSEPYVVPSGIILTRFAYEAILHANRDLVKEAISDLEGYLGSADREETNFNSNLKLKCEHLEKQFSEGRFPEELRITVQTTLKSHDPNGEFRFAVRSSSWAEDEEDMSAAGQLTTLLNVNNNLEQLEKAAMACFASKFSYTSIEYRRQHGLPVDLPMAVVIQKMVDCDKAGVLFTCDPTSGDTSVITITGNYGLGESVVSGQVDIDSIRVRRLIDQKGELRIESKDIGAKSNIIGNREGRNYDTSACCLTDEEILRLSRCSLALVAYFRCARDIEWGFAGGELCLFQSRPVTSIETYSNYELLHECEQPSRAENNYTTRANIGEVLPYGASPLVQTYSLATWNIFGNHLFKKLAGFTMKPYCSYEVMYDGYHSFFNLRCSLMFPMIENKPLVVKALEVGFFGRQLDDQPQIREASRNLRPLPFFFEGPKWNFHTFPLRLRPKSTVMAEKPVTKWLRRQLRLGKLIKKRDDGNKMLEILDQLKDINKHCFTAWQNHILIAFIGSAQNMALYGVLSKYIDTPTELFAAVSRFLSFNSECILSALIPELVDKMATLAQSLPKEDYEKFLSMSNQEAVEFLERGPSSELTKEFANFLELFGHRCYNEFELSARPWGQDKAKVVEMIKLNCQVEKRERPKKMATNDEVIESLNLQSKLSFIDRMALKHSIAPKCQQYVALRERTKDILIEFFDIIREAFTMLSEELVKNQRIPDKDLVFYLFYDELEPICRDHQPSLVMQAIRRRNMCRDFFSEPLKYGEIIKGVDMDPILLIEASKGLDKELSEAVANAPKLHGTPASSGQIVGPVCLVEGYKELHKVKPGHILVTHSTDIAFSPVFPLISGIVTEVGGLISHGAVVAREYGLPSLLGIPNIMKILKDGEKVLLDANSGTITRLSLISEEGNETEK